MTTICIMHDAYDYNEQVPQFQPGFAKTMFEKFLADETF